MLVGIELVREGSKLLLCCRSMTTTNVASLSSIIVAFLSCSTTTAYTYTRLSSHISFTGTAEVESALVAHEAVAQAAVVGQPHAIKGQSICAFCMLTQGFEESPTMLKELKMLVRQDIGGFASPDVIITTPSLPMTRSGKIMRRILRKIVAGEVDSLGDTSTLADPSIVDTLIAKVEATKAK